MNIASFFEPISKGITMMSGISSSGSYSQIAFSSMRGGTSPPDIAKMQEKVFAKMDANNDSGIDKSELSAFLQKTASTKNASDSNASDSSDIDDLFSAMDADGDGSITQQESSDAVSNLLKQLQGQMMNSRMGGAGGMPPPMGPPPDAKPSAEEMFSSIDSDSDGNISQTELSTMLEQTSEKQGASRGFSVDDIISRDDANGDGQISQDEFSAATSYRRGAMESPLNDAGNSQNATASSADANADAFIASLLRQYQTLSQGSANSSFANPLSVAA